MIRKISVFLILFITLYTLHITQIYAQTEVAEDAQAKAEEIHRIAISDVIYTDEEVKALYYQNIQIIELLKEIRSLLQQQLEEQQLEQQQQTEKEE